MANPLHLHTHGVGTDVHGDAVLSCITDAGAPLCAIESVVNDARTEAEAHALNAEIVRRYNEFEQLRAALQYLIEIDEDEDALHPGEVARRKAVARAVLRHATRNA